ncbi:MAG: thioredoxin family protein [Sphaerospermopsis sp. SIO1G2]|nr:thioredoxin family protein [Sphaerospermopsis sp. SIO1G1]NET70808.1 thioredoxin family protein [Sphaerospermopsis sp. SIO1G2]
MNILETMNTPIGSYAPDFELPGIDERVHHLSRYLDNLRSVCVISMYNQCPCVEKYTERLKKIQAEFAKNGFTLIGLNSYPDQPDQDSRSGLNFENMKKFSDRHQLTFPYLWDTTQDVTHSLGATTTVTAFLIDGDGILRYKGQIDDHPDDSSATGNDYLKNAITSLFLNQEIQPNQTPQVGTPLIWRK